MTTQMVLATINLMEHQLKDLHGLGGKDVGGRRAHYKEMLGKARKVLDNHINDELSKKETN